MGQGWRVMDDEVGQRAVGMAIRAGFAMPEVVKAQSDREGRYVALELRSSSGVVMYVTPEGAALRGSVLDLVFLQEYVMVQLGLARHRQVLPLVIGVPIVVLGILLSFVVGVWPAILAAVVAIPVAWSSYEWFWNRRFMRRVDRRLADLMGAEVFQGALRGLAESKAWPRSFGWLYEGALPLPPERLSWL